MNHGHERPCAGAHLKTLNDNDVVVVERGDFCFAMRSFHTPSGLQSIFRLQKNLYKEIDDFRLSDSLVPIIQRLPSTDTPGEIKKPSPAFPFTRLSLRRVNDTLADETFCMGTTRVEQEYTRDALKSVYPARGGIDRIF